MLNVTPTDNECRDKMKTIIEAAQVPTYDSGGNAIWGALEPNKWVVFAEWPESFDIGEDPTVLQSAADTYTEDVEGETRTTKRVNAWIISESRFTQERFPKQNDNGQMISLKSRGKNIITRTWRVFYFYSFGGVGERVVADRVEAVRRAFNDNPVLGFAGVKAEKVDGHNGLQMELEDSGDFKTTTLYIRGGSLQARLIEPLQ